MKIKYIVALIIAIALVGGSGTMLLLRGNEDTGGSGAPATENSSSDAGSVISETVPPEKNTTDTYTPKPQGGSGLNGEETINIGQVDHSDLVAENLTGDDSSVNFTSDSDRTFDGE